MGSYHELIPIDSIELDYENPRIARFLEIYDGTPDAQQVAFALRSGIAEDDTSEDSSTTFRSLKESIRTNGGIINPIIVNKVGDRYVVIEGNTRLAIFKEFNNQAIEGEWSRIPGIVYENMDRKKIDAIRLQAHLVGVRPWDPYSKAKYLSKLRNEAHLTWNEIIDFCGGKKEEATRYISAYEDMEMFYRPLVDDSDFDATRFSGFVEYQKKNIRDSLARHGFTTKDFATWIRDGKLYPLETVRRLPAILDNEEARAIFLKRDAKEARKHLDAPAVQNICLDDASIKELAKVLTEKLRDIPWTTMRDYRDNPNSPEYLLLLDLKYDLDSAISMVDGNQ